MLNEKSPQERVAEFTSHHTLDAPLEARLLDLAAESGELAKEFLKSTSYGQKEFHPAPEWEHEIGDVYFALICVALKSDIDLEAALDGSMQRYSDRVREHGTPENPR